MAVKSDEEEGGEKKQNKKAEEGGQLDRGQQFSNSTSTQEAQGYVTGIKEENIWKHEHTLGKETSFLLHSFYVNTEQILRDLRRLTTQNMQIRTNVLQSKVKLLWARGLSLFMFGQERKQNYCNVSRLVRSDMNSRHTFMKFSVRPLTRAEHASLAFSVVQVKCTVRPRLCGTAFQTFAISPSFMCLLFADTSAEVADLGPFVFIIFLQCGRMRPVLVTVPGFDNCRNKLKHFLKQRLPWPSLPNKIFSWSDGSTCS